MKSLRALFLLVLFVPFVNFGFAPQPAPAIVTATILPKSLVNLSGSKTGAVSALAFRDQSSAQNTASKYVSFNTPGGGYRGYGKFYLPPHIVKTNISGMKVRINYRGLPASMQVWTWRIYDWNQRAWVKIGSNANAVFGKWTLFTFNIPAPYARFIGTGREMRLQLQSNNALGDALIDYESISVTYSAPLPGGAYWQPGVVNSWQIQYTGTIDTSLDVQVYNLDGADTPKSTVDALHARGIKVMCYFSAGSWENWRADANQFPAYVLGKTLDGWADEKWLDIRRIDILAPIMTARMDMCKSKGFDGVDPDNVDGYANDSGMPLTAQDQLNYNLFLAHAAHSRGLAIGLKNDLAQIPTLVHYFDWSLNEQCFYYNECNLLLPFINAGKPVFNIEYELNTADFCAQANNMNFNSLKKNLLLDAHREPCR